MFDIYSNIVFPAKKPAVHVPCDGGRDRVHESREPNIWPRHHLPPQQDGGYRSTTSHKMKALD